MPSVCFDQRKVYDIISLSLFCKTNIGHCSVILLGILIGGTIVAYNRSRIKKLLMGIMGKCK